jgi:dinuclear metal center YbgI/SA1388 family protein
MPTVETISAYLDRFAPPELAAEWDNVGLLFGDPGVEVQRLLTCLTVTPEVVAEAVSDNVQLLVSHHPVLFRATKRFSINEPDGKLLWPLARAGVSIYSPHTAFDNCAGGINDMIARKLGLPAAQPLRPALNKPHKIVVFVPDADLQKVSDAMFEAGAGNIGQYSQCSFRLSGTGTFFGSDSTNPTVGRKGRREEASEWRLEAVCPEAQLGHVLTAIRRTHSYEEPAYDVYPLRPVKRGGHEGRVGLLKNPTKLEDLAAQVKQALGAGAVQVVGHPAREVKTLAIACGAAGEYLADAHRAGADVFLTGEMRFHDYLKAKELEIALILPGHYATERPALEELAVKLQSDFPSVSVWASRRECDPVSWH